MHAHWRRKAQLWFERHAKSTKCDNESTLPHQTSARLASGLVKDSTSSGIVTAAVQLARKRTGAVMTCSSAAISPTDFSRSPESTRTGSLVLLLLFLTPFVTPPPMIVLLSTVTVSGLFDTSAEFSSPYCFFSLRRKHQHAAKTSASTATQMTRMTTMPAAEPQSKPSPPPTHGAPTSRDSAHDGGAPRRVRPESALMWRRAAAAALPSVIACGLYASRRWFSLSSSGRSSL